MSSNSSVNQEKAFSVIVKSFEAIANDYSYLINRRFITGETLHVYASVTPVFTKQEVADGLDKAYRSSPFSESDMTFVFKIKGNIVELEYQPNNMGEFNVNATIRVDMSVGFGADLVEFCRSIREKWAAKASKKNREKSSTAAMLDDINSGIPSNIARLPISDTKLVISPKERSREITVEITPSNAHISGVKADAYLKLQDLDAEQIKRLAVFIQSL
ncbi:hypothetical protein D3C87_351210 [compost metagenome]